MARVLLIAPTIDRFDVGEAWVAYQSASRLARRHELTVLTYTKRGRAPVSGQLAGARVIEWAEPALLGRAERLNSMLKPGYVPFFARARRWVKQALADGERFDVAHQPLPVAMRYPTPVLGLGIPYVIGPVGGSLAAPAGFTAEDTAPWFVRLRALDHLRLRHEPWLRRTYEEAACVVGIGSYVEEFLAPLRLRRFVAMTETGIDSLPDAVERRPHATLRLLFVGRVIRTKGVRDAVRALSHLDDLDVHLDVVGDGFDRPACEQLSASLGQSARITFHGATAHEKVLPFYDNADVFLFPSYREPGGNVVFEAMAAGLPLVVNDRGGPANVVDDRCGLRVPALDPDQYAHDLAQAVRTLAGDPGRRRRMGDGARDRVREVGLWDAKLEQIDEVYRLARGPGAG